MHIPSEHFSLQNQLIYTGFRTHLTPFFLPNLRVQTVCESDLMVAHTQESPRRWDVTWWPRGTSSPARSSSQTSRPSSGPTTTPSPCASSVGGGQNDVIVRHFSPESRRVSYQRSSFPITVCTQFYFFIYSLGFFKHYLYSIIV